MKKDGVSYNSKVTKLFKGKYYDWIFRNSYLFNYFRLNIISLYYIQSLKKLIYNTTRISLKKIYMSNTIVIY